MFISIIAKYTMGDLFANPHEYYAKDVARWQSLGTVLLETPFELIPVQSPYAAAGTPTLATAGDTVGLTDERASTIVRI
ncbi:hypothetical protein H9P43_005123 [Blastocladiella emersonii ATCC 22665]|nr:hypothetical protein H9P43_005123 [Blastocladiella emersonii ATCC 22665]